MQQAADQACHELIRIDMLYGGISFSDSFFPAVGSTKRVDLSQAWQMLILTTPRY
jgi:hypothetical protein